MGPVGDAGVGAAHGDDGHEFEEGESEYEVFGFDDYRQDEEEQECDRAFGRDHGECHHDPEDGSGSAEHGDVRVGVGDEMNQAGADAAGEI